MPTNPDIRLKQEYGSVKAALLHCAEMNLNKAQSACQLGIAVKTLRERAGRLQVTFPDGYLTRDTSLQAEVCRERMSQGNKLGVTGGKQRWAKMERMRG